MPITQMDRDADGRNGVGIEHLQRFDVGGDQGDQVTAVTALQLCRGQAAQRAEHLIPDEGQQLEGDIVVGGLLCVAQNAAQQGKDQNAGKGRAHGASGLGRPRASRMPKPPKMVMKVAQKWPATPMTMAASMMGSMGLTSTISRAAMAKGLRCFVLFMQASSLQCFQLLLGRYRRL